MNKHFEGKSILVTGGTGSIGSEIVRQLLKYNPKRIVILSRNEEKQYYFMGRCNQPNKKEFFVNNVKIDFFIGDIRDASRVREIMRNIDIVFHSAAMKHITLTENNPCEAAKTNILGTQNLVNSALEENIENFITISTDKAANPINTLGATKLVAEKITLRANIVKGNYKTKFSCVRFGNVLNSSGSVFPVFVKQIKEGGPLTLTNPKVTRFIMTIPQAASLVLKSSVINKGGEVFILKMPSLYIKDLAEVMIEEIAQIFNQKKELIHIKETGMELGEKLHEELMSDQEISIAIETEDMFIIPPFEVKIPTERDFGLKSREYLRSDSKNIILDKESVRKLVKEVFEREKRDV